MPIFRASSVAVLRTIGIDCCEVAAGAGLRGAAGFRKALVPAYSYRLMRNFADHPDFRGDLAAATRPLTIFSGAADELMLADKYAEAVHGDQPRST